MGLKASCLLPGGTACLEGAWVCTAISGAVTHLEVKFVDFRYLRYRRFATFWTHCEVEVGSSRPRSCEVVSGLSSSFKILQASVEDLTKLTAMVGQDIVCMSIGHCRESISTFRGGWRRLED